MIKKAMYALALMAAMTLMQACGDKKNDGDGAAKDSVQVVADSNAPVADKELKNTFTATLGGKTYSITITRAADDSLPVITDEQGKQYLDNRVQVVITSDGNELRNLTYTKGSFSEYLSAAEKEGTVLLGMAYDPERSDARNIRLGAQIGQVGIEEGPAFCVEIPVNGGAIRIVRDNNQDTTGNDGITT